MKQLKLYVPVVISGIAKVKKTYKFILVGVHNTTLIRNQCPTPKDIGEHLMAQRMLTANGGVYTSIKINVSLEEYQAMCQEISRKIGRRFTPSVIDIIFQLGQKPIIQIIGPSIQKKLEISVEEKQKVIV
jgi:hypothetical protein